MRRIKEKYSVLRQEIYQYHTDWDYWDDDFWDDDRYDHFYDRYYFDYLETKTSAAEIMDNFLENKKYYNHRRLQENYNPYHIVDIESIFTVAERRAILIDRLLDDEIPGFRKPLFEDIFKKASN